jgi:glycerol uptake facilitator-like aquaporin
MVNHDKLHVQIVAKYQKEGFQCRAIWEMRLAAEFFGTMILIVFGNGAVANMALETTTGRHDGGWLFVALGYGFGVMIPAFMFGSISGNHLNPAITIAFASVGVISMERGNRLH